MNQPPSPPTSEEAVNANVAAIGLYDNYAGGVLIRWTLDAGTSELHCFGSELVFDMQERFADALARFQQHGFIDDPPMPVQHLDPSDFERADAQQVIGWSILAGRDGLLWRLVFRDGSDRVLLLRPPLIANIQRAWDWAIENIRLIDLRPYEKMRWTQMADLLQKLPGAALRERVTAFEFSVEIFNRNAEALTSHLKRACGPMIGDLVRWDRRFEIDTFLMDAIHLLFNFVSASMALVDHTRGFFERYYEPRGKLNEYQPEIRKRFHNNGLVRFIQELRNLMAHVGLVGLVHEKKFVATGMVGRVVMWRDDTLIWDGWTAAARRWLKDGPPDVDMLETVTAYVTQIDTFHTWFRQAREACDWQDYQRAELLRRAILARRGLQDIPSLSHLLNHPATDVSRMRDAVGMFLTAEQQFNLREWEKEGREWLSRALDLVREHYFVDQQLGADLLKHFAGTPAV